MKNSFKNKSLIYVEFIGLPGSGKTTIAKAVFEELVRRNIVSDTYFQRITPKTDNLKFFADLPKLKKTIICTRSLIKNYLGVLRILKFYLSLRPFIFSTQERRSLFSFIKMFVFLRIVTDFNKQARVLLVDRGYVNMMTTITLYKNFKKQDAKKLLEYLYSNNLQTVFIFVDIDPETGLQRIKSRPPKGDYRENLPYKDALFNYNSFHKVLKEFCALLLKKQQQHTSRLLDISGENEIESNKEKIIAFIEGYM